MEKCYNCKFAGKVPGSAHFSCSKKTVIVAANNHGIQSGWFMFPFDFDPNWLEVCTGFFNKTDTVESKTKEECFALIFNQFKVIKKMHEEGQLSISVQNKIINLKIFEQLKNVDNMELSELRNLAQLMIDM